jgi:hypothetical protein
MPFRGLFGDFSGTFRSSFHSLRRFLGQVKRNISFVLNELAAAKWPTYTYIPKVPGTLGSSPWGSAEVRKSCSLFVFGCKLLILKDLVVI